MKTSNKILLVLFLSIFGFIVITEALLSAKYGKNDYTPEDEFNTYYYYQQNFINIHHVYLNGLAQCQVYTADTTKLMLEKASLSYAEFYVHADTLFVKGVKQHSLDAEGKAVHSPQEVRLYIPASTTITAINSNIGVDGDKPVTLIKPRTIILNNSNLYTRYYSNRDSVNRYFDTLTVFAKNKSGVYLFHNDYFKKIDIVLDSSIFNDSNAKIDDLHITADTSSTVVVNGTNIPKLNAPAIGK
ncbi:MAG TPA: hypothetical protein VHB48_16415 [Chitinophagaceae bacterium]|nr:hypothetical protein [Chitinophagaceae bacterium]